MSREIIAKSLKRLREQAGLTADEVGALVGKSGKTVNAWENNRGQPDAEMLMKLCDIYNVGDILAEFREETTNATFSISDCEKKIILAYRNQPDMQPGVRRLLGVECDKSQSTFAEPTKKISDDICETIVKNEVTSAVTNIDIK